MTWSQRCLVAAMALVVGGQQRAVARHNDPPEANPAALKAFTDLVNHYRGLPSLTVKSTVTIAIADGDAASKGSEVKGEFTFGGERRAVIKLRGFTCYLAHDPQDPNAGTLTAVHEGTADSYYTGSDQGSPYYALLNEFRDLPFPMLAIMLGEDAIEDVLLQFHPKALNGVVPTALETVEQDGTSLQRITLTGDHEVIEVLVSPDTKLIQSIELKATGGAMVQQGAKLTYTHTYEYQMLDARLPLTTFEFDPGQRQRVDLMAVLIPRPVRPDGDEDGDGPGQHGLVGKAAPGFVLSTADGKAVDLEELNGRVVVLDFWASWCGPCMAALPKLHEVAKWASREELPVTVLTINVWEVRGDDDTPDARLKSAQDTWNKRGFTLPIIMDYTDETAAAYGVRGIPTTVVIRADGIVHAAHAGASPEFVEQMKKEIQEALKAVE